MWLTEDLERTIRSTMTLSRGLLAIDFYVMSTGVNLEHVFCDTKVSPHFIVLNPRRNNVEFPS